MESSLEGAYPCKEHERVYRIHVARDVFRPRRVTSLKAAPIGEGGNILADRRQERRKSGLMLVQVTV
jgi:hypothetical protein